jgi:uncharacterized membrane protein YfcA
MLFAALALGIVMGVVVGGLGGGGGVLTVPALVYVLGQSAHDATASSVIIVGTTAAVGTIARIRGGDVDWRNGVALGVVGIPAAYLGTFLNRHVSQPVLLLAFATLTIISATAMVLDAHSGRATDRPTAATSAVRGARGTGTAIGTRRATGGRRLLATIVKIVLCGAAVGFVTGFLGVGGGFLVVPAVLIVLRMPMPLAVGTSLLVIVLNSVSSVVSRLGDMHLDWHVIAPFTVAAVTGTLIGKRIADRLTGATLANAFAVMLVAIGLFVGVQSIIAL